MADEVTFTLMGTSREDVRDICKLYHQAQELHAAGTHIVSIDEKTGIQALERIHPNHAMSEGKIELQEFEYKRHGTQTLLLILKWLPAKLYALLSVIPVQSKISSPISVQPLQLTPMGDGFLLQTNPIPISPLPW